MRFVLLASLLALATTGCALRPRYADFVSAKTEGKEALFVLIDTATSQPIPGAKVDVSELRNRITVTTGADGTFALPVDKKYIDENPVFLVTLPKGISEYKVVAAPKVVPVVVPVVVPPAEVPDAGMPASNG